MSATALQPDLPDARKSDTRSAPRPSGWLARVLQLESLLALSVVALVVQTAWPAIEKWIDRPRPGSQVGRESTLYQHLIYLPRDYGQTEGKWPLLVHLHGAGERSTDMSALLRYGLPRMIASGEDMPAIVVSPLCLPRAGWEPQALLALVDQLCAEFDIDEDRLYLTGCSMGGFGVWELAHVAPQRFAAIVPICGGGDPSWSESLRDVPTWAFHGTADDIVPVSRSEELVASLRSLGAPVQLTLYQGQGHHICDQPFRNSTLLNWLLAQRRDGSVQ